MSNEPIRLPDGTVLTGEVFAEAFRKPAGPLGRLAVEFLAGRSGYDYVVATQAMRPLDMGLLIEVGCADGRFAENLWRDLVCGNYLGIDHAPEMIEAAVDRNQIMVMMGAMRFACAPADNIPWGDGMAGGLLCLNMLIFVLDPEPVFREFARVLRPGAQVVIGWPLEPVPDGAPLPDAVHAVMRWHDADDIATALMDAGFHNPGWTIYPGREVGRATDWALMIAHREG